MRALSFSEWARETANGVVCEHSVKRRSCVRCLRDALAQAAEHGDHAQRAEIQVCDDPAPELSEEEQARRLADLVCWRSSRTG